MFTKKTYTERRKKLLSTVNEGVILLLGNEESSKNFADNWYPFRQDSTFMYYAGITDRPGLHALLDADSGEEYVFGTDYTLDDIVWMGNQPSIAELAEKAGINNTGDISQLKSQLQKAINSGRTVHILPPYRGEHYLHLHYFTGWPLDEIDRHVSRTLIHAVAGQRNHKSQEEIEEIEKAVTITGEMHLAAMRYAQSGMMEYEVMSRVHETALQLGGQLAFPIICTKDGQTLHNHHYGNKIGENDLILVDAGAETALGYAGDMTRTFPAGRKFTSPQADMYQIVLDAHLAAVETLKPGVSFRDIHLLSSRVLFEGLKSLGITRGDTEAAVEAGAHTMFFQCGLGHLMGLDVHDMENLGEQNVGYTPELTKSTDFGLKSLRLGRPLEEGYVVTVEPGIYIIPQLIDMWKAEGRYQEFIQYDKLEQYKNFGGIRIEEDFVITSSGYRLLGKEIPKTIEAVENERT